MRRGALLWMLPLISCGGGCQQTQGADAGSDAPVIDSPAIDAAPTCTVKADFLTCSSCWAEIPAGSFVIGSPPTEPGRGLYDEDQTPVTLTHPFWMQTHELTQAEWSSFCIDNPSGLMPDGTGDCSDPQCPVGNMTWWEALAFANLASLTHNPPLQPCYDLQGCTGTIGHQEFCTSVASTAPTVYDCDGYRLPTEVEWEYAARAGTTTAFYSGDIVSSINESCPQDANLLPIAWYCANAGTTTHPVGQKQPNAFGLYDMLGNAYEWTSSTFTHYAWGDAPLTDPSGLVGGDGDAAILERVMRGGIFNFDPRACRAASRRDVAFASDKPAAGPGSGFRLVRTKH